MIYEEYDDNAIISLETELNELRQREKQRKQEEANSKLIKAIKKMYEKGFSISEIAEDKEISEAEVRNIYFPRL